jgi:hypothetical protein
MKMAEDEFEDIEKDYMELSLESSETRDFLGTRLRELHYTKEQEVFRRIRAYLSPLRNSPLWKDFKRPSTSPPAEGWQVSLPLSQIVPNPQELVWFCVTLPLLSLDPVFEGTTTEIEEVTSQCRLFQYYIIGQEFNWVVAKSCQNEVIATGEIVERNLKRLKDTGGI